MSARKDDAGKPPISLIPRSALLAVARVMAKGKARYGAHNWRSGGGMDWSRLIDAAMRHVIAFADGEDKDEGETGSGELHLANAICCLAFLIEYYEQGLGTDDRYKRPEVIAPEPVLDGALYEVYAKGGKGADAWVGTFLTENEAETVAAERAHEWPTFNLYVRKVTLGHSQTA